MRNTKSAALAVAAVLAVTTQLAHAQTFAVVHDFTTADSYQPEQGGLIQATNGDLYGTTQYGGVNGEGSVFKMTPGGTLTTLYNFCPPGSEGNCVDAFQPGPLTLGANGKIYGTTIGGGGESVGLVFEMTPAGAMTVLTAFCGLAPDGDNACGANPVGALVQGTNGAFYGVTAAGGVLGQGVAFAITNAGSFYNIHGFACIEFTCNNPDSLVTGLIQGTDGNFYGTTEEGGTGAFGGGNGGGQYGGSVFKLTPKGALTTLYSFCSLADCTDGQSPTGVLVQGADGNFYGTTKFGGLGSQCYNGSPGIEGCGTVFQITPEGTFTTLHNFCTQSGCPDGQNPVAGLIQATDGNFYGTTYNGGGSPSSNCSDNPCGTIFQITSSGALTTLVSLCDNKLAKGCVSGGGPVAPLVQHTNGDFYGTTTFGGNQTSFNGTVFWLSTGLSPFVKTVPTSGLAGAEVLILGNDLTGATSVTFNGTPATFTVKSSTYITATVPAGATSGQVQVITPAATLTSNLPYVVEP
jgi:uncharacterized repeat protein (TIGR03803 family)